MCSASQCRGCGILARLGMILTLGFASNDDGKGRAEQKSIRGNLWPAARSFMLERDGTPAKGVKPSTLRFRLKVQEIRVNVVEAHALTPWPGPARWLGESPRCGRAVRGCDGATTL